VPDAPPSFFARLWLAIVCALRVIVDPSLAQRVVRALGPAPHEAEPAPSTKPSEGSARPAAAPPARVESDRTEALAVLALLQREGRLVDFLQQDIDAFGDAEVGSAARVVHSGCRKALRGAFDIVRIRDEAEGASITVPEGFDGRSVKLTGNVRGSAPYRGVLRHAGWRVKGVRLPEVVKGHDATVIAPAEVEL
jgi:hypothetical protein